MFAIGCNGQCNVQTTVSPVQLDIKRVCFPYVVKVTAWLLQETSCDKKFTLKQILKPPRNEMLGQDLYKRALLTFKDVADTLQVSTLMCDRPLLTWNSRKSSRLTIYNCSHGCCTHETDEGLRIGKVWLELATLNS